jgi:hypothetical protein
MTGTVACNLSTREADLKPPSRICNCGHLWSPAVQVSPSRDLAHYHRSSQEVLGVVLETIHHLLPCACGHPDAAMAF